MVLTCKPTPTDHPIQQASYNPSFGWPIIGGQEPEAPGLDNNIISTVRVDHSPEPPEDDGRTRASIIVDLYPKPSAEGMRPPPTIVVDSHPIVSSPDDVQDKTMMPDDYDQSDIRGIAAITIPDHLKNVKPVVDVPACNKDVPARNMAVPVPNMAISPPNNMTALPNAIPPILTPATAQS